jgi:AcrR family transcriptional regulator
MPRTRSAGLRDHLIAAADDLLDDATPGSLTTRQIARHAAVSDGVLYNHFGDKDELLVAALVRRYGRLLEAFEARVAHAAGQGTGTEAPLGLWLQAFALALRDLNAAALHLAAGLLAEPRLLQAFWTAIHAAPLGLDRLTRPLADRLRGERDAGRLPQHADLTAAVNLVFGAAGMSAITLRVNGHVDHGALNRQLAASIDLVLAGLTASPAGG